ncbi:sensor histidine kinase [Sphingobacterium bovistauri]|uniref:Histidine kinase n=1 Tax=Sphingobacterium bovistauri TaxID=2781959 RepID=A0ABS7Z8H8_9SPHI|nr:histidine kinase [Sphingobacterium bovistauri]MCA5005170.1 histidine kinase [Sphingobacterium bovistauri]
MKPTKDLINKIEFWIATIIYILVISTYFKNTIAHDVPEVIYFIEAKVTFSYFYNYFFPKFINATLVYIGFLLLNFLILQQFRKENSYKPIAYIALALIVMSTAFGVTKTHLDAYELMTYSSLQKAYNNFFFRELYHAFKLTMYVIGYFLLKELLIAKASQLKISGEQKTVKTLVLSLSSLWLIGFLFIQFSNSAKFLNITWTGLVISALTNYIYVTYFLLPKSKTQNRYNYYFRTFIFTLTSYIPISIILILISRIFHMEVEQPFFLFLIFSFPINILIIAPLAQFKYNSNRKTRELIGNLRGAIDTTNSNLNLLKSQINPHFLFNTLNSLYGTAIVEEAHRTSIGIQKLGDMMRFMLHENTQDYISLNRDIAYLEDYIVLQNLRLQDDLNDNIVVNLERSMKDFRIVPMLLIPFVENAYKFSISNLTPSKIEISLKTEENVLFFDVTNSINPIAEQKKEKSGVGLENVKSRLEIFYPNDYELVMHKTPQQYFVHLKINLEDKL